MSDRADAIEIVDAYDDDAFHLHIEKGSETFNLRIVAPNLDFQAAFEAANETGLFVPEDGVE